MYTNLGSDEQNLLQVKKIKEELKYNNKVNHSGRRESVSFDTNKFKSTKTFTQTEANHAWFEEYSHPRNRESFSPIPPPSSLSQLSSSSLPSMHEKYENTERESCRSELNSDLVSEESCSRREFNDYFASAPVVENYSYLSVFPCTSPISSSSSSLLSSSFLTLSSSSPSICCYTIAGSSKDLSKPTARADSPYISKIKTNNKQIRSIPETRNNSIKEFKKYSHPVIPQIVKIKTSPPPIPPKPSKNRRNNSNINKYQNQTLNRNQEKSLLENVYYNPISFRRKLEKFEKQNKVIGKSKNNATKSSCRDGEHQGDERCEFFGCCSVGGNTVSDSSCVCSVLFVSDREKKYNIVYPTSPWSNYCNFNGDIDIDPVNSRYSAYVNTDKNQSPLLRKKVNTYQIEDSSTNKIPSNIYKDTTSSVAVLPPVIIRKLTPKLIKELKYKNIEIASRRCASYDILNTLCNLSPDHLSCKHNFDQLNTLENNNSTNIIQNSKSVGDFPQGPSKPYRQNIFKSLSDTNNAGRSNLFPLHTNLRTNSSNVDIKNTSSLDYVDGPKCTNFECECCRKIDKTQCNEINKDIIENYYYYKIAHYRNHSSANELHIHSAENSCNTDQFLNIHVPTDSSDSLSSPLLSLNIPLSSGQDTIGLKKTIAVDSFGYISKSYDSEIYYKEPMMEKPRNTLDRWQRLAFGKRSSPTSMNQEKAKKSIEKSEKLKELTELLRRNRSSPTPPPVPPPRKSRHAVSASSSLEQTYDPHLKCLSTQSDEILLMDHVEENVTPSLSNSQQKQRKDDMYCKSDKKYSCDTLKPNISLSSFETFFTTNEPSNFVIPTVEKANIEISTKLPRPESRTVIGSYTRKGIPFRSASFSQFDYSPGKYIGTSPKTVIDRQPRGHIDDVIASTELVHPKSKLVTQCKGETAERCLNEDTVYINPNKIEMDLKTKVEQDQFDNSIPHVIPEEEFLSLDNDLLKVDTSELFESKNLESINDHILMETPTTCVNDQLIKSQLINEPSEAFESNLATLVEEEIPLESPPDNFLQTATTCLIPVPVYECSAEEWNVEGISQDWMNVGPDELNIYQETVFRSKEKYRNSTLKTLPIISVSQDSSTQTVREDECGSRQLVHDANHKSQESFLDHLGVKKRYSHDDMEIGNEKRSSLERSLQRLCSSSEERKRIDKSKRRKGMYIENTDWVDNSDVFDDGKMNMDVSLANSNVEKSNQVNECSPIIYLNSPEKDDLPTSVSMYSSDLNTSESESCKPLRWNEGFRQNNLSCQSSEERDDGALVSQASHKNLFFLCTESVSDNESERNLVLPRDGSSPSPALSDQDFKRYSKRPLRGPYGQMLEAEMKKPNRLHFEEALEELKDSNSSCSRCTNYGRYDTRSKDDHPRHILQYSNSFRLRKNSTHLPVPTHTRAASTPSQIESIDKNINLAKTNLLEKRYQSSLDNSTSSDRSNYSSAKANSIKPMHVKSSSLVPFDKQKKQTIEDTKLHHSNRTVSECNLPADSDGKEKNIMPSPALLAELLQGVSEKLVSEQRYEMFADTRTHVVQEIFRNEQSYVESLQTVVLKYFKVLKMPENAGMIDSRTVDEIFFMVPDILTIHERFLNELRSRLDAWEPQQKVGDAFIETFSKTEVLEVYTSFVNNCNRAKNAIRTTKQSRPSFARFLESTAREHKGKLTLDNLLIKPVQKFPNYEMLFTRLIKHTDQEHPDQKHLQEVLKLVHDILVHINCKEREILENGQREATLRELEGIIEGITELIAPDRQFLLFDLVSMPSGQGARKERGFFLFNDLLVITSIKRRSGTIRKPNTASCPGSVASTLDANKYKFLTKVSLDNLDIIKSKDENLRKIMNEIEQLADDCNKLQQIAEVSATIKYPHQMLEDVIRDLHRDVQRQLSDRQSNDTQLNMLELTVNSPSGSQKLTIIFGKAEKRSQWEEMFNEAKQKLAATLERYPIPEFMTSIPIVKTRAGLQFTCAAPTLSEQKDVWVCNSDGYVGQVCVMSLLPEPNVTSCNGVCNARILCLTSVPASTEIKNQISSLNEEDNIQEFRKNFLVNQSEKKNIILSASASDIQLDSNSSSDDSETETNLYRETVPSPLPDLASTSNQHQIQNSNTEESESNQSTMWLGTEDGFIHVYNCTDTIRIKKNKIKIQHASAVYSILYSDDRVFVSLANGDICVYLRDSAGWNTSSPLCISIGTVSSPVNKLLNVHGMLWCSIQGIIKVLDTKTLQVVNQIQISSDSKPITNMAVCNSYVWISIQNSAHLKCFHSNTHQLVTEVNLAPAVNKMLSNCDDIIRQHKAACLRVTSLLSCKDLVWIGTSAGVLLTIPAQGFEKGSPNVVPTGIPHGHTGHVRFLTFVETPSTKDLCNDEIISSDYKNRRSSKHCNLNSESSNILIISGGDGYEDFRNSGANTLSEIAGREDSTNHLLIWQI